MLEGLKPMSRQYVHLSLDTAMALEIGRRKSKAAVVIEVDARGAHESSVPFYEGNEKVWLADFVPVRFMRLLS